jgi:hypothetical protein
MMILIVCIYGAKRHQIGAFTAPVSTSPTIKAARQATIKIF